MKRGLRNGLKGSAPELQSRGKNSLLFLRLHRIITVMCATRSVGITVESGVILKDIETRSYIKKTSSLIRGFFSRLK